MLITSWTTAVKLVGEGRISGKDLNSALYFGFGASRNTVLQRRPHALNRRMLATSKLLQQYFFWDLPKRNRRKPPKARGRQSRAKHQRPRADNIERKIRRKQTRQWAERARWTVAKFVRGAERQNRVVWPSSRRDLAELEEALNDLLRVNGYETVTLDEYSHPGLRKAVEAANPGLRVITSSRDLEDYHRKTDLRSLLFQKPGPWEFWSAATGGR